MSEYLDISEKEELIHYSNVNESLKDNNINYLGKKREINDKNKEVNDYIQISEDTNKLLMEEINKTNEILNIDLNQIEFNEIKPTPPSEFIITHPPNSLTNNIDIIKLTSQYVAILGKNYMNFLIQKYKNDKHFQFLNEKNKLFGYFIFLVNSYQNIILNKEYFKENLNNINQEELLKLCYCQFLYEYKLKKLKGKEYENVYEKNEDDNDIDWLDFYLVETIDFSDEENDKDNNEISVKENIYDNNNDEKENKNITEPHAEYVYIDGKKYLNNYEEIKNKSNKKEEEDIKCPLCGLNVSVDKIDEHLKIELLEPKWKDIQKNILQKNMNTNLTENGGDLIKYLKEFCEKKDI